MTVFRIDVCRKSGEVMLWMESPCGLKPVIGWQGLNGVREFAEMLLEFYNCRKEEKDRITRVSDDILSQVRFDEKYFEDPAR